MAGKYVCKLSLWQTCHGEVESVSLSLEPEWPYECLDKPVAGMMWNFQGWIKRGRKWLPGSLSEHLHESPQLPAWKTRRPRVATGKGHGRRPERDREVLKEPWWFHLGCSILSSLQVRHASANTFEISAPATIWLGLIRNPEPDHLAELLLNSCPQTLWGRILKWVLCLKPLSSEMSRLAQ